MAYLHSMEPLIPRLYLSSYHVMVSTRRCCGTIVDFCHFIPRLADITWSTGTHNITLKKWAIIYRVDISALRDEVLIFKVQFAYTHKREL